jgi:hypothetical protein
MKKVLRKILIGMSLILLISIAALVVLILNPQIVFARKVVYKNFNIYSNYVISNDYKTTLDFALEQIEKSELYSFNQRLDIFLCDKTSYNIIDTKILGPAIARNVHNNILLKIQADFKNNLLVGTGVNRNLKKTIAHEAIHFFQMKNYGMLKFNPLNHPPVWKLEGYPEYIAYQDDLQKPTYTLVESIEKLKAFEKTGKYLYETEPGQYDPLVYYKGRVMIEFLKDIKKLSYTEILHDSITENLVTEEMTTWYQKQVDIKTFVGNNNSK